MEERKFSECWVYGNSSIQNILWRFFFQFVHAWIESVSWGCAPYVRGEPKSELVPESHIREHFEGSAEIEDFERVGQNFETCMQTYIAYLVILLLFILSCIVTSLSSFIMIHSSPSILNSMGISAQHWWNSFRGISWRYQRGHRSLVAMREKFVRVHRIHTTENCIQGEKVLWYDVVHRLLLISMML